MRTMQNAVIFAANIFSKIKKRNLKQNNLKIFIRKILPALIRFIRSIRSLPLQVGFHFFYSTINLGGSLKEL